MRQLIKPSGPTSGRVGTFDRASSLARRFAATPMRSALPSTRIASEVTSRAILTAKEYQKRVTERLQEIFAKEDMVREEWAVSLDAADGFADPRRYAPRLDIAVGPFNISHDIDQNVAEINSVARDHWLIAHIQDGKTLTRPDNPRCLLAIEIKF